MAFPGRAPRHLGRRPLGRAGPLRRQAGRQDDSRRRRDQQARPAVPARPRHWQANLRRRGASRAAERGAARAPVEDSAVPAQAATARAHVVYRGRRRDGHARARGRLPEAHGGRAAWRPVPAARVQAPAGAVSGQSRRRQLGRHGVQSAARISLRQHERARPARRRHRARSRCDGGGPGRWSGEPCGSRTVRIRGSRVVDVSRTRRRT